MSSPLLCITVAGPDMTALRIMVSRHSAFYSPLLAGIVGPFFKDAGFEPQ